MVEGAPLLRVYGSKAHRGFESLPLRQIVVRREQLRSTRFVRRIAAVTNIFGYNLRIAPVAQLDRACGYEPQGREFESLRARHHFNDLITLRLGRLQLSDRVAVAFETVSLRCRRGRSAFAASSGQCLMPPRCSAAASLSWQHLKLRRSLHLHSVAASRISSCCHGELLPSPSPQ